MNRILYCPADQATPQQFLRAARVAFNPPMPVTRSSERYDATRRFCAGIWGKTPAEIAEASKAHVAELEAIDARYGEVAS